MYIKHLPFPNLMKMHGKLLNALQINDLILRFLYTCVHVCMLYMYMCIISIIPLKYVHIIFIWITSVRQMESIIRCVLHSWNPNRILNHNVNNVQLMYCTCIYGLIMYMHSKNNYCYINLLHFIATSFYCTLLLYQFILICCYYCSLHSIRIFVWV